MKTTFNKSNMLLGVLALLALVSVGCSSSKSSSSLPVVSGSAPEAYVIGTSATNSVSYTTGSTVTFKPSSISVMNKYVATHPLNNPTNIQINVNLTQSSSARYGGVVSISYYDNGIFYKGQFNAGLGTNVSVKGLYDNGTLEANYNYWFKYNNQVIFTGYFQDSYGAITMTLIPTSTTSSSNDAEPSTSTTYKGYIYFKNFSTVSTAQSPYRSCWFIYDGSYDCRSDVITNKCGQFPGAESGYTLLGTFTGLTIKDAFNLE